MTLHWLWPWAALIAVVVIVALVTLIAVVFGRKRMSGDAARVYNLDDDLNTEYTSRLFHQWRVLNRLAVVLLVGALALTVVLIARPAVVDRNAERSASRDIVLCLDVSGSTLPYDRAVIETYLDLVNSFQGERIGLSIFNSTSRTVFPLTDDYDLVTSQLKAAAQALRGVETQDDIDKMSDKDYQRISDWLEGTQNRKDSTSLIGDGLVSCAAMLPGFVYGSDQSADSGSSSSASTRRAASIVLATDNVASGTPTYTLTQALDLTSAAHISVDGLYSGPTQSESDETTVQMQQQIESHGGVFLTQSAASDISGLVREIDHRRVNENKQRELASLIDVPGWWTLALVLCTAAWMLVAWRLRR
ncbi:VWA domain-containing protein [Bifidobacterium goeldii]|uniref:VWA domain-containing protein n=1 Tax=Bifidobacterium goeldii TaxID=2306975 RepID=A0A430FJS2_9BIFI|nr:VWA domain-containing protein [Bifidobacterium goeldii]RSX53134.1 VWA domain-containing protein [Bifidobacterium goeldii]